MQPQLKPTISPPWYQQSKALAAAAPTQHGFFGRAGGVSEGIYTGLNCGLGSKDAPERVRQNRARVTEALDAERLYTVYQCHTTEVAVIDADTASSNAPADAMVTQVPGVALGILTADCAPVLLADLKARVIGAAHAGWKGAVGGILENTVAAMERLGASRSSIVAAIGPCIAQASYEVGPEFVARILEADRDNQRFFAPSATKDAHAQFDLSAYVAARLTQSGIAQVEQVGGDTCAEEARYFSYRRSCLRGEPDYGREISCILLRH